MLRPHHSQVKTLRSTVIRGDRARRFMAENE
jgi:hypothetical protein